ncbi:MAG: integration host factor subunit beta [Phycisphaerae bacterium]|nr:integration host factor subunit beta [Phycisphaerae bacterium]MCZ2398960.1 integration host factor subunit beta [Phycisphaerae bacterium]NUQ49341.1 integration host factor subunit beta [Phycisphaerae bacterium]
MTTASSDEKTITKKDLVDRIADATGQKRVLVKRIVQNFLEEIVDELGKGNRLEFRDFGVFELRERAARIAQNPKTMEKVRVPSKRTVKFKVGRLMKERLLGDAHPGLRLGASAAVGNSQETLAAKSSPQVFGAQHAAH